MEVIEAAIEEEEESSTDPRSRTWSSNKKEKDKLKLKKMNMFTKAKIWVGTMVTEETLIISKVNQGKSIILMIERVELEEGMS